MMTGSGMTQTQARVAANPPICSSPRPAASNCEVLTVCLSGAGTVSVLKVANDSDFWNAVIIVMPKSAGG